jgi:hypothetical protein
VPVRRNQYGGRWLEFSALDARFASFDQFLSAADQVAAAFQGHPTPLTVGRPTTFRGNTVVIVKDTVFSHYGTPVALTVPPEAINLS